MVFEGSCHCGRIDFEVDGDIDTLMDCNCSICTRRGYLLWFVPRDSVRLKTPETDMSTYSFNEHKIMPQLLPEMRMCAYRIWRR